MFPYSCRPPIPRPEPFSPLPWRGAGPDWGKWIRDRLAEKGALLAFPSASAFPTAGAAPSLYLAEDTGVIYRWDGAGYAVLVDPSSDVKTYSGRSAFPDTGRSDTIYIDASTNLLYRWDETGYVLLTSDLSDVESRLAEVESKVPAQATAQNQLADKDFVNSSIATNTATFRGTYNLSTDLSLTPSATDEQVASAIATKLASLVPPVIPENNDYCFVQVPYNETPVDPDHIERIDRYKCTVVKNGTTETRTWGYEFSLNNSSFTAAQWAAINSGITSGDVAKLGGIEAGAQVNVIETIEVNGAALTPDEHKAVKVTVPVKATTAPLIAGEAAVGASVKFAAENHVHPAETSVENVYRLPDDCFPVRYLNSSTGEYHTIWGNNGLVFIADAGIIYMCDKSDTDTGYPYGYFEVGMFSEAAPNKFLGTGTFVGTGTYDLTFGGEPRAPQSWPRLSYGPGRVTVRGVTAATVAEVEDIARWKLDKTEADEKFVAKSGVASTVTKEGANPVKSSGIWTAIWGALAALPTGFASLYDWCVSQLAGKVPTSRTINSKALSSDVTLTANDIDYSVTGGAQSVQITLEGMDNALARKLASTSAAPKWVSGTTYTANALVTYNGVVYQNTSSGTIQSATTPDTSGSGWTAKPVSELFLLLTGGGEITGGRLFLVANNVNKAGFEVVNGDIYLVERHYGGGTAVSVQTVISTLLSVNDKLDSTSAAPAFSTSSTYEVGDHVTYNGKLYRCTTAVTTAGAWNSNNWTEVQDALSLFAPLASPAFTGTPTAPTPTAGDDSTKVATTAFVQGAVGSIKTFQHDAGGYFIEVEAS